MNLLSSAAKFGGNIFWQEFWIAPGDVYVKPLVVEQTVEHTYKIFYQLNFIKQNVIFCITGGEGIEMIKQRIRVAQGGVFSVVKRNVNDMVARHTLVLQIISE